MKKVKNQEDVGSYYLNVVEELNDFNEWCISDQGVWGIPIPYFTRKDTGEVLMDTEIIRHVSSIFKLHSGSDAWFKLPIVDLLPARYKDLASKLDRGTQVFDVWFENGLSWDYVLTHDAHSDNQTTIDIKNSLKQLITHVNTQEAKGGRKTIKSHLTANKKTEVLPQDFSKTEAQVQNLMSNNLLQKYTPAQIYVQKLTQINSSYKDDLKLFPANLVFEGYDQHSRWFLTSLVTSVILTGSAPFRYLKTHGMLLDDKGDKISKSGKNFVDPADLIEGTIKLSGERMHGYGIDTIRAWAITKDGDTNNYIEREDIESVNSEIKLLRGLIRLILGHIQTFNYESNKIPFDDLTLIDKVMMAKILKFAVQVTEAYDTLDLKKVYQLVQDFCQIEISNFYLEISRERLQNKLSTSTEYKSTQFVYKVLFDTLVQSIAPIVPFTAQEAFMNLPHYKDKPLTVFQNPTWFRNTLDVSPEFLQQFKVHSLVDELQQLRNKLKYALDSPSLSAILKNGRTAAEIVFEHDENVDDILSVLDSDLQDFFFGCSVKVLKRDEISTPLKQFKQDIMYEDKKVTLKIKVLRASSKI